MSPRLADILLIACLAVVLVAAGCGGGSSHAPASDSLPPHFTVPAGMIGPDGQEDVHVSSSGSWGHTLSGYGPTGATGVGTTGEFGPTGNVEDDGSGEMTAPVLRIGPTLLSSAGLEAEVRRIRQPIYWVGPKNGFSYEFTRTPNGNVYVRYLPQGVKRRRSGRAILHRGHVLVRQRIPGPRQPRRRQDGGLHAARRSEKRSDRLPRVIARKSGWPDRVRCSVRGRAPTTPEPSGFAGVAAEAGQVRPLGRVVSDAWPGGWR